MITIIDYGAGNIRSIVNMLRSLSIKVAVADTPEAIRQATRLILPGVGHFDFGMSELENRGLVDALNARVLEARVPILGICLGAQLLTRSSEEGQRAGLGWIDARTVRFDKSRLPERLRIPHMGWSDTWAERPSAFSAAVTTDARFYYVHSYHLLCDAPEQSILAAQYGYPFTAAVQRDNIAGVQFHPEKSHRFGMQILKAFAAWQPGVVAAAHAQ